MKKLLLSLLTFISLQASAQLPTLVKEIATSMVYDDADPSNFLSIGDKTFFVAYDPGKYLWVTDGTASGTSKVSEQAADPLFLGVFKDKLYFSAYNDSGRELWYSDGTAEGTQMLKDIHPTGSSNPRMLIAAGDNLFFTAFDGTHGTEWWVTNGTTEGTRMTADLEPSQGESDGQFKAVVPLGNTIVFSRIAKAEDQSDVWILGHEDGPVKLTQKFPTLYYKWKNAGSMIKYKDKIYFNFQTGNEGEELFVTDGTVDGTYMLNFVPGSSGFSPNDFFLFNDKLCFTAYAGGVGNSQLFISDGTLAGTINTGVYTVLPSYAMQDSILYFSGRDQNSNGLELYKTDGTTGGTVLVKDIRPGYLGSGPSRITCYNGKVYFTANDGINASQPWVSDGTAEGTVMLKNIYNGTNGSFANNYTGLNGKVYFTARTAFNDFHLYETDGTPAGTRVIQPADATNSSNPLGVDGYTVTPPTPLQINNGMIFFRANYHNDGRELYKLGGTVASADKLQSNTSKITVYPNPVKEQFTLSVTDPGLLNKEVIITDITGKVLHKAMLKAPELSIPTQQLAPGIYFIHLSGRNLKIIKE